jgi:type IV secretory pathway VirB6-like protein
MSFFINQRVFLPLLVKKSKSWLQLLIRLILSGPTCLMSVEQTFSLLATTSFALKLLGMIIFLVVRIRVLIHLPCDY